MTAKKQKHNWRLGLAYALMTALTIAGVVATFAWTMGFRVGWNGEVSQVALAQLNSFPTGARVTISAAEIADSTPAHINITTGRKFFKLSLLGYRDWSTSATVRAGDLLWLNYARLVPDKIATASVKTFTQNDSDASPDPRADFSHATMLASPDQNFVLLHLTPADRTFSLAKIANPAAPTFTKIALSDGALTAPADGQSETFSALEWSRDSRSVLLDHRIFDASGAQILEEFLSVDTQKLDDKNVATTQNISRDFGVSLSDPHFASNDGKILLALVSQNGQNDVRRLDYGAETVSAPLVANVENYAFWSEQTFAFVSRDDRIKSVGIWNAGHAKIVAKFALDRTIFARFMKDNGRDFLAVYRAANPSSGEQNSAKSLDENSPSAAENSEKADDEKSLDSTTNSEKAAEKPDDLDAENTLILFGDPLENSSAKSRKIALPFSVQNAKNFAISPGGRFVVSRDKTAAASYDVETKNLRKFSLADSSDGFAWVDGFHLLDAKSGAVGWAEFNGENRAKIADGFGAASLSADGKFLFSLRVDKNSSLDFQRSQLVVN